MAVCAGHSEMHSRREELFVSHHPERQNDTDLLQVRTQPGIRHGDHAVFDRAFCQRLREITSPIEQFVDSRVKYARGMTPGQFVRAAVSVNRGLIESQCVSCGSWIAAGPDEQYLAIAESAHHCAAC